MVRAGLVNVCHHYKIKEILHYRIIIKSNHTSTEYDTINIKINFK